MDYGYNGNIQRQRMLDMHNMLRSYEAGGAWGKGAVYMLRLVYDMGLESYAKNYAEKLCETGHWGHSKRIPPHRVAPGENLYVNTIDYSGQSMLNFDPGVVVKKWWDERKYYDWNSPDPSAKAKAMGQLIGHYTQVVRAEASAVGCWIITGCQCKNKKRCRKENNPPYWSTYMACHYDFGNVGWFPYWPLAFPHKIPSSITKDHRKRCGNCPKGYTVCGTTGGHMNKRRDAYLCVGYWDKNKNLPSPDLLQESIRKRHSPEGLPSWVYMIRHCDNNGGCPSEHSSTGSKCWMYKDEKNLNEPKVLFQQCICKNFKTSRGTWFQRDACLSVHNSKTPFPLTKYGVLPLKAKRQSWKKKLGRHKIHNQHSQNEVKQVDLEQDSNIELYIDPIIDTKPNFLEEDFSPNLKEAEKDDNIKTPILDFKSIENHEEGSNTILLELQNLIDIEDDPLIDTSIIGSNNLKSIFDKKKIEFINKNKNIVKPELKKSESEYIFNQNSNIEDDNEFDPIQNNNLRNEDSLISSKDTSLLSSQKKESPTDIDDGDLPYELQIDEDLINQPKIKRHYGINI